VKGWTKKEHGKKIEKRSVNEKLCTKIDRNIHKEKRRANVKRKT
jgi:hypothetical protein